MPIFSGADSTTGRQIRKVAWNEITGKPTLRTNEIECLDFQGEAAHRPQEDYIWNDTTKVWEFSQTLRDELDYNNSDDKLVDDILTNKNIIKALILALNDGTFVPGSNYTNTQLKNGLKNSLN
tara:strand:- start:133 stop:501 length:369 start_codon:yes stop_codon:yes gene_type:complete